MLILSKAIDKENILFPVKDSKLELRKCWGYPYNCVGGFAMAIE